MVRPWHYLICLLLIAPRLWAAPLSVRFLGPELEQGRTVRVVLGLDRPRPSLEGLDLSPWSPWLVVERRGGRQLGRDGAQTMVVWLTPRVTGQLQLPPLSLGGQQGTVQSAVQDVHIAPARDPKGGAVITPRFPALPKRAWLRQQLIYAVSLDSRQASLRLEAEPAERDGFLLLPIPPQSEVIGEGSGRVYRHTSGWLLFPTRPGTREVKLPALRTLRDGVSRHRFYPPTLSLEVQPLPAYLPPGVAVGRIELQGTARPWRWRRSGELQSRRFAVVSHGVPAAWWRPPEVEAAEPAAVRLFESPPRLVQHIDASGLTVRYEYRQALSLQSWGWHALQGRSRLYGFDPASGKLQALDLRIPLPLSLTLWQQVLLGLMLLSLLWWAGRWGGRHARAIHRRLFAYRAALRCLVGPIEVSSLRRVLGMVAVAEGWQANLALGRWGERWRRAHPVLPLDDWLAALEAALYGRQPADVPDMADALLAVLRKRLGPWRWICEFRLQAETGQ